MHALPVAAEISRCALGAFSGGIAARKARGAGDALTGRATAFAALVAGGLVATRHEQYEQQLKHPKTLSHELKTADTLSYLDQVSHC